MTKPKSDSATNIRMAQNALQQLIRYLYDQGCSRNQVTLAVNAVLDQIERKAS